MCFAVRAGRAILCAMKNAFTKYHALGNDYLVVDPKNLSSPLTTEQVKTICHRNYGVGSDGILLGPLQFLLVKRPFSPRAHRLDHYANG